jgi:hypothetical protein
VGAQPIIEESKSALSASVEGTGANFLAGMGRANKRTRAWVSSMSGR